MREDSAMKASISYARYPVALSALRKAASVFKRPSHGTPFDFVPSFYHLTKLPSIEIDLLYGTPGPIPVELAQLGSLTMLDLSANALTGKRAIQ